MKKIVLLIMIIFVFGSSQVSAATDISLLKDTGLHLYSNNINPTASKDTVSLTFGFNPVVMGGIPADYISIKAIDGCTLSKSKVNLIMDGSFDTYESTNLSCTSSGVKSIYIIQDFGGVTLPESGYDLVAKVTFTSPTTTTTTTENNNTSSTPTSTSTTQTQEKEEAKKPETPVLNKLRVGENELTGEKLREENQFKYEEGVKFSGTTVPNGIVHLYFNSDPYETTVTADKDGNWEYTLDKDLGEGSHTLEIAVEDPETNELSDKSEAYSFTLVAGETTSEPSTEVTQEETEDTSYPMYFWFLIGGIVVVLVGSGIGGWYYFKKKKGSKKEPEPRLKNQ